MRKIVLYIIILPLIIVGCVSNNSPEPVIERPLILQPPPTPILTPHSDNEDAPDIGSAGEQAQDIGTSAEISPAEREADNQALSPTAEPLRLETQFTVSATPGVPRALIDAARAVVSANPDLFYWEDNDPSADVLLAINEGTIIAHWFYVVAAPFATIADATTWPSVASGWESGTSDLGSLFVDPETAAALSSFLGASTAVQIISDDFIGQVWSKRPSWIIIPFENLRPEWKVIHLDGRSPLEHGFNEVDYPLAVPIGVIGDLSAVEKFLARYDGPVTNREAVKLSRVAMTGVTALVRATAAQMERNGILWPGEEVGPVLQSADIAHISNEVSFAADCPPPDPFGDTTFCSRDPYFELIKQVGIDVIELTGNHLNDYGREPLSRTIDMYEAAEMQWFGGGRNLEDAGQPAIFEHNGNRIAFVGCNPVGPANDWALIDAAGSRPCDDSFLQQIGQLRDEGYVVIATLQYNEHYVYFAPPDQRVAFSALAAAGANIVSGSQAHHAQGFSFEDGAFIHYGPGNLFFDQMDMMGTRQSFVDTYTIYDGRVIGVDLWTGLIENWARPRLMTAEERADLLQAVFEASGW